MIPRSRARAATAPGRGRGRDHSACRQADEARLRRPRVADGPRRALVLRDDAARCRADVLALIREQLPAAPVTAALRLLGRR